MHFLGCPGKFLEKFSAIFIAFRKKNFTFGMILIFFLKLDSKFCGQPTLTSLSVFDFEFFALMWSLASCRNFDGAQTEVILEIKHKLL